MLEPVLTLDADLPLSQAREALAAMRGDRMVLVRRRGREGLTWFALPLAVLGRLVAIGAATRTLGSVLDEAGCAPVASVDLADPSVRTGAFGGVVTRGGRALGYAAPAGTPSPARPTRRLEFPRPATPSAPGAAPSTPPARVPDAVPGAVPAPAADADDPTQPADPAQPADPPVRTRRTRREATVYPRVSVPAEVAPAQPFDVEIGLDRVAQTGVPDAPMTLRMPARKDHVQLTVTVVADGFEAPEGVSRTLLLPREDLVSASVRVPLVAHPIAVPLWAARVEVEYAVDGTLLGRAWRDILVHAGALPHVGPSQAGGDLPLAEGDAAAVDLTVSINEGATPGRLVWTFTSPHPLGLPDEQVSTDLPTGSAQAFALGAISQVADADGTAAAESRIEGVARVVASATPVAFWSALTRVWTLAKAEGRVPRVLVVASEPHVPWELASTEKRWVVDRTLVDEFAPQVLGAQVQVGRWAPAGPETPSGVRRPPAAPEPGIEVERMAVVVGDYHSTSGVRPLPFAEEEGQALVDTYPAVRLSGTLAELTTLLEGRLVEGGQPTHPQIVHVACHGAADPTRPGSNGIVLSDTAVRIDELVVLGGELGEAGAPLVFLNACQLAQGGCDLLGDQGGLAAAFLAVGARGFVAPLWSVDDELARDIAVDFYRYTLGDGLTVGEALRRLRIRFSQIPGHTQTTPLAYVYYGHPDLRLALAG